MDTNFIQCMNWTHSFSMASVVYIMFPPIFIQILLDHMPGHCKHGTAYHNTTFICPCYLQTLTSSVRHCHYAKLYLLHFYLLFYLSTNTACFIFATTTMFPSSTLPVLLLVSPLYYIPLYLTCLWSWLFTARNQVLILEYQSSHVFTLFYSIAQMSL